jgi:hypothetical protein
MAACGVSSAYTTSSLQQVFEWWANGHFGNGANSKCFEGQQNATWQSIDT